jgi:hypothetical protein
MPAHGAVAARREPRPPARARRLGGELRPVAHAERRIAEATKLGFSTVLVPAASAPAARGRTAGARIVPCRTVVDALTAALGAAALARGRGRGRGGADRGPGEEAATAGEAEEAAGRESEEEAGLEAEEAPQRALA